MSSKIRLDDLPIDTLDELDNHLCSESDMAPRKREYKKPRKRQMIEDYMEQRSLKRRLSESYDLI